MYTHSSIVSPAQAQYVWWERRVLGHSEGVGKATGDPQLRRDPTKAGKGHIFWGWTLTFMDDTSTSIVKGKYHPYNFLIKWPNCSNFNFPMLCIEASEEPKFELGDKFKNLEASSARQLAEKDKAASLGTNTESKFGQVGSLNLQFVSYIYIYVRYTALPMMVFKGKIWSLHINVSHCFSLPSVPARPKTSSRSSWIAWFPRLGN